MLRLIIADDHFLLTESLSMVLQKDEDINVVATAHDGDEALEKCMELSPDIILMDIKMPKMNGIEAAEQIKKNCMKTRVAILTSSESSNDILAALERGVDAYLLKDTPPSFLATLVKCICNGYSIISDIAKFSLTDALRERGYRPSYGVMLVLKEEERQIIRYLSEGKSNKEISQILNCGEGLVQKRITEIIKTAGVENRAQLVMVALENNLI